MTTYRYDVVIEWDPDDHLWVTYVPALNHLSTYGATRDEALQMTREAIEGYLETAALEGIPVRAPEKRSELVELEVSAP